MIPRTLLVTIVEQMYNKRLLIHSLLLHFFVVVLLLNVCSILGQAYEEYEDEIEVVFKNPVVNLTDANTINLNSTTSHAIQFPLNNPCEEGAKWRGGRCRKIRNN